MLRHFFNRRTIPGFFAILIVAGTVFYSDYLADKIAAEERQKVEQWVEAGQFLISAPEGADTKLPSLIRNDQHSIPIIETDEKDSIISWINFDSSLIVRDSLFLQKKLTVFKKARQPIVVPIGNDGKYFNKYYYGNSDLLQEVRYYPMVQLLIVGLFIILMISSIVLRNRSTQNQVWAGMAKETAHQLGTPVSSLQGWVEMLKETDTSHQIVHEIEKDVDRLKLVSDRFGKIGSTPKLTDTDLVQQLISMTDYMKRRAADKVQFDLQMHNVEKCVVPVSPQLFDWVIENLLKNALDAMEGEGRIVVELREENRFVIIEVSDTGKGIPRSLWTKIFKPGFTTKKRGWGLGLSLSKRIIEQYHKGRLFVKHSEPNKGTTFRIELLFEKREI
ncbi:MAG: sensor histidine kinase [Bacteroidota bacterium]